MGICETVAEVVTPFLEKEGLKLWDVEFKKEGAEYFLRVYIDRESGVGIDDCVTNSTPFSKVTVWKYLRRDLSAN